MKALAIALGATSGQLVLTTTVIMAMPLAAPVIAPLYDIDIALLGGYISVIYILSVISNSVIGNFVARYGAVRITQAILIVSAIGLLLALPGGLPWFLLSVLVIGSIAVSSGPPSADILFSITPPRLAPLIFSIKQAGQPAGGAFAGLIVPLLVLTLGWREGFIVIALGCIAFGLALSPMHGRFGTPPKPTQRITFAGMGEPILAVIRDPGLRMIGLATPFYLGLQMSYSTFAAAYFVDALKLDLTLAGVVYAASQVAAAVGRILWGAVAVRVGSARIVFAALGLIMGVSSIILAFATPDWPIFALYAVSIVLGGTAIAWNGLMFAEVARLSPPGRLGVMTGGMVGLSSVGGFAVPILFGVLLSLTGSYVVGFICVGIAPLLAGLRLGIVAWKRRAEEKGPPSPGER